MRTATERAAFRGNVAAIAFGTAGLLMLGLQPILLEQLILAGSTTLELAGVLAMAEIIAIGLGAALSNVVVPLRGLRTTAVLATAVLVASNVVTPAATSLVPLLALRVGAGLGGGVLVWITTQAIVRFGAPERLAGLYLLTQSCGQALAAFSIAIWGIPRHGLLGGFYCLAGLSLVPLLLLSWLPRALTAHTSKDLGLPPLDRDNVLSAASMVFAMAVVGALWTFLEALGRKAQLAARPVQLTITAVLLTQIAGASCAAWLAPRLGAKRTLVLCNVALLAAAVAYLLLPRESLAWFVATCAAFGFLWLFMMPFHVKLALVADPRGRLAVQVPALQLLGSALGPLTASLVMKSEADPSPAYWVGSLYAVAALLLVALSRTGNRSV